MGRKETLESQHHRLTMSYHLSCVLWACTTTSLVKIFRRMVKYGHTTKYLVSRCCCYVRIYVLHMEREHILQLVHIEKIT